MIQIQKLYSVWKLPEKPEKGLIFSKLSGLGLFGDI